MKRAAALAAALLVSAPVCADELWAGFYDHDATFADEKFESGSDIKAGWIGTPIDALSAIGRPAPHVLLSAALDGGTDYAAAGLNWKFGTTVYLRPGIGLSINNGPRRAVSNGRRVDLGSRVTFEPEAAVGWRLSDRLAIEASWVHLSHATLFSKQNRGIDSLGVRLLVTLP
jgi:hypothetical protein